MRKEGQRGGINKRERGRSEIGGIEEEGRMLLFPERPN